MDRKIRFISLTSNPSVDGSRKGTDQSANGLAGVLDHDLVYKHRLAYERQTNKFVCHLARAERPIMIWIRSLNEEDLDKILNAQRKGLFRYSGEKILLSDEGVQQLELGYNLFNQEPYPSLYRWTEILGKIKLM